MSEDVYDACGQTITWSEGDSEFGCLCTEQFDGEIGDETVKSLALLGAAVRLAWMREAEVSRGYIYIPYGLPDNVLDAIRRVRLGGADTTELWTTPPSLVERVERLETENERLRGGERWIA